MRLDKFTIKGQEAIETAVAQAEARGHQQVEPEHVLSALIEQPEGITQPILGRIVANGQTILTELEGVEPLLQFIESQQHAAVLAEQLPAEPGKHREAEHSKRYNESRPRAHGSFMISLAPTLVA